VPASPRPARRSAKLVAVASVALLGMAAPASAAGCTNAETLPGDASAATLRGATVCLLNRERSARGLGALRLNDRLSLAAERHARDMVVRSYFSHDAPGGADFVDRIRRTGYVSSARSWRVGENLAWGSGELASPRSVVERWMASPGHRANVLGPFREVGYGMAPGAPSGGGVQAATYATEFGTRG